MNLFVVRSEQFIAQLDLRAVSGAFPQGSPYHVTMLKSDRYESNSTWNLKAIAFVC
jgi:hypothetical protein